MNKNYTPKEHLIEGRPIAIRTGKIPNHFDTMSKITQAMSEFLYKRDWVKDFDNLSFGQYWSPGMVPIYRIQHKYLLKAVDGPKWQYVAWKNVKHDREIVVACQDFDFDKLYMMLKKAQDKYGKRKNFQMICEVREIFLANILASVFCVFD